jgi:hypothetical protein
MSDNVRLVGPGDEFNVEDPSGAYHAFRIRPDGCFIAPRQAAQAICNGVSGFYQHDDDASTLREIRLLCSVLADQTMRTAIMAAITAGTHTLLA